MPQLITGKLFGIAGLPMDALVTTPTVKHHDIAGVSGTLKLYASFSQSGPWNYHGELPTHVGSYDGAIGGGMGACGWVPANDFKAVRKLHVVDMIRVGTSSRGWTCFPDGWIYTKTLVFSTDPVAADRVAIDLYLKVGKAPGRLDPLYHVTRADTEVPRRRLRSEAHRRPPRQRLGRAGGPDRRRQGSGLDRMAGWSRMGCGRSFVSRTWSMAAPLPWRTAVGCALLLVGPAAPLRITAVSAATRRVAPQKARCRSSGVAALQVLVALDPALFPKANEVPGWQLQAPPRLYRGTQVFDYMDGAGEIPRSYGLQELGSALYRKGRVTLEAAVFDMGAPSGAFGYFSERSFLDRSPTGKDRTVRLDHPARLNPGIGILTFWKGRYTVILQPQDGKPDEASLLQFARRISARIKERGAPPALLRYLPRQERVPGTLRYLRGKAAFDTALVFSPKDAFGAAKGARAAAVESKLPGGAGTLALVQYPTTKAASEAFRAFSDLLEAHKAVFAPGSAAITFTAYSPKEKGTGAFLDRSRLAVVLFAEGPTSPAQRNAQVAAGLRMLRSSLAHPGPPPK